MSTRTRAATEAAASTLWERDLEAYLATLAERGRATRAQILRRYVAWVRTEGARTPRQVKPTHVQRFQGALSGVAGHRAPAFARVYAPQTIASMMSAVRGWHRFLSRERGYDDPCRAIVEARAPVAPRPLTVLSATEMALLRAAPYPDTPEGWRDGALLHLLCATGARSSELVVLRPFDFEARHKTLRLGHGSDARKVPLDAAACQALRLYVRLARPLLLREPEGVRRGRPTTGAALEAVERARAPLFVGYGGRALPASHLQGVVKKAAQTAELPDWVRPSTLRASHAVLWLRAGDAEGARRNLGGRNALSFGRHAQVADDALRLTASLHPRA